MLAGPLPSSVLVVCCFLYAPFSFLFNKHAASIEHAIAYCVMLFIAVVMHGDDGVREFRRELCQSPACMHLFMPAACSLFMHA